MSADAKLTIPILTITKTQTQRINNHTTARCQKVFILFTQLEVDQRGQDKLIIAKEI